MTLLDTHASLLVEMRKYCADSDSALGLVKTRLVTTENLIATFKQSTESLVCSSIPPQPHLKLNWIWQRDVTNREEVISKAASLPIPVGPSPKPHVPAEPALDPSGLFSVDANPTPVERLAQKKPSIEAQMSQNQKRKYSEPEPQSNDANVASGSEPKRRKASPSDGRPVPAPEEEDSFVRRVEARTRAKEERRRTKMEKKRKRQSDSSINSRSKGPKNKKQKQKHGPKLVERQTPNGKRSNAEPNSNGIPNGQPTKKRKKS